MKYKVNRSTEVQNRTEKETALARSPLEAPNGDEDVQGWTFGLLERLYGQEHDMVFKRQEMLGMLGMPT